jgi:hypothetical protein
VATLPDLIPSNKKKTPPGKKEFMFELIAWSYGLKLLPDDPTSKYFLFYHEYDQKLLIKLGRSKFSAHTEIFLLDREIERIQVYPSTVQLVPAFIAFTVFR